MIALVVGVVVAAVALIVRVIVVWRSAMANKGGVSHQWIDDNIYKREGGDR